MNVQHSSLKIELLSIGALQHIAQSSSQYFQSTWQPWSPWPFSSLTSTTSASQPQTSTLVPHHASPNPLIPFIYFSAKLVFEGWQLFCICSRAILHVFICLCTIFQVRFIVTEDSVGLRGPRFLPSVTEPSGKDCLRKVNSHNCYYCEYLGFFR